MIAAIGLAILVTGAFAASGPWLARAMAPATAVRLLVPASVLLSGCGAFVVAAVAFIGAAQLREVAEVGHWSPARLHALSPISGSAATVAAVLLIAAAGWAGLYLARTARGIYAAQRACQGLPATEPILVVDSLHADAFTIPGLSGRIVVTTALLHALDDCQQQALLAHERSHLRHRHPWWLIASDLAAAVNPLLRTTADAVRRACERWADEDAAAATSRRLVAETVAHSALLVTRQHTAPVLAATGGEIPDRVRALLRPAPRTPALPAVLIPVLAAVMVVSTLVVQHRTETLFETAEQTGIVATAGGVG